MLIAVAHQTTKPSKRLLGLLPKVKTYSIIKGGFVDGKILYITIPKVPELRGFGVSMCKWEKVTDKEYTGSIA